MYKTYKPAAALITDPGNKKDPAQNEPGPDNPYNPESELRECSQVQPC